MDPEQKNPQTQPEVERQWEFYRDLRRSTMRRANLAIRAEARRRKEIEQAMRVIRQRRLRKVE